jgi:hypothetical protein
VSDADETIVVRITLRKHVAERLRKMCHARGMTASHLVDRWVFLSDDNGEPKPVVQRRDPLSDFLNGDIFGGTKR